MARLRIFRIFSRFSFQVKKLPKRLNPKWSQETMGRPPKGIRFDATEFNCWFLVCCKRDHQWKGKEEGKLLNLSKQTRFLLIENFLSSLLGNLCFIITNFSALNDQSIFLSIHWQLIQRIDSILI